MMAGWECLVGLAGWGWLLAADRCLVELVEILPNELSKLSLMNLNELTELNRKNCLN